MIPTHRNEFHMRRRSVVDVVSLGATEVGVRYQTADEQHLALQRNTAEDVERFLASGGKVTVVPPGATGLSR